MYDDKKVKQRADLYEKIGGLIITGAFLVVLMISLLSEFGIHPDENDVRVCLDWCTDRWIWPDMRLEGFGLGDTYSGYGYTKVCNYTPYFLIFSKISYVFKQFMGTLPYYRVPNLLLMLFMTVYILRKLKGRNWLLLGFGICVQAWYIFSYVTADAQDFVLAFISVAMLADEDSMLWKTVGEENSENTSGTVIRCILLGLMYGVLMLGKPYYYATLVLTFGVLVWRLIKTQLNYCKPLLARYLLIAGVAFAVFAGRAAVDLHYYGLDKAAVSEQMEEKWADDDKKPSAPDGIRAANWHMREHGADLGDMFRLEPEWFVKSYRSLVSARITSEGDEGYFIIIGFLYLIIYAWIGVELFKTRDFGIFIFGTALSVIGVAASVWFSYTTEIQAQGRYLLPLVLTGCYLGSRARALWDNRVFKAVVLCAACLSVAYFGLFDSRKLIDLGYVRTLF